MRTKENKVEIKKQFDKIICHMRKNAEKGCHEFYNTYGRLIFGAAKTICKTDDVANVVVNSVLIKIWKIIKKDFNIANPLAWIYVITLNCAKDTVKGNDFVPLNENITAGKNDIDKLLDDEAFFSMIRGLPDKEQELMVKRFCAQNTFKEIAQDDDKPLSTVTTVYYRCLEKIKNNFEKNKKFE